MKFSDLANLSNKDAKENASVQTIKEDYLKAVEEQNKSIQSLHRILISKFDGELNDLLNSNQEIKFQKENDIISIQFGAGDISIEIKDCKKRPGDFGIKKMVTMKRGSKSNYMYLELAPVFGHGHNVESLTNYVDLINRGEDLNIQQIQDLKSEYKKIKINIEVLSSSLPLKYYVYKSKKEGNGKANESQSLEEMLDRAISASQIFN